VFVTVYEQALLRSPQRMKVRFFLHVCGLARATVDAPKRTTLSLDVVPERQTDRRLRLVPLPQSLVYAFMLFQTALSSALVEIISPSLKDPNLIWPYVAIGAACMLCIASMWIVSCFCPSRTRSECPTDFDRLVFLSLQWFRKMDENQADDFAIGTDRAIDGLEDPHADHHSHAKQA
jgi:hypothetical protein